MIGFLIKKTFYDLWDNLFRVALINLGFIASLSAPVFLPGLLLRIPALSVAVLAAGILWCFVYLSAAALSLKAVSDYGAFGFGDFLRNIKEGWPAGIVMGIAAIFFWSMVTIIIPTYLGMGSFLGLILAALVFWIMIFALFSLQFFFAIRARLEPKPVRGIKKSFIIFIDNPGFCVFSFLHNLVILAVSCLVAFLFPGPAGILLFLDEGIRLRLLKYDWLEANPAPAAGRRRIPWDAILIDEREKTGTRSLKNFIFPWKD
ncbi:MAG: hypothetical protein LBP29_04125 [Treponema sp.]|jgi:hypothetical protein|nr:hypothetical protein [Treponema sp.]